MQLKVKRLVMAASQTQILQTQSFASSVPMRHSLEENLYRSEKRIIHFLIIWGDERFFQSYVIAK